jgi:transcriptional regulator with XRE-family HTH domain
VPKRLTANASFARLLRRVKALRESEGLTPEEAARLSGLITNIFSALSMVRKTYR